MTRMDLHAAPAALCRQHLLGNHSECHQLAGYLRAADADTGALHKLLGHAARGHVDLTRLREWHDALAAELDRRGYHHDSPLAYTLDVPIGAGMVGANAAGRIDERCAACAAGMGETGRSA